MTQYYVNKIKQKEIEDATAELDAFMTEFMLIDDDFPLSTQAEALPKLITLDTPNEILEEVLKAHENKPGVKDAVIEAEKIEAKVSSIHLYDVLGKEYKLVKYKLPYFFNLTKPRIKAVVDWLKLEFSVDENYSFAHPTKPFQDIRKFLKTNEINKNAYVEQLGLYQNTFRVNLYDINSSKKLHKITKLLEKEYGAKNFKIVTLELSIDFWNLKSIPFLLALAKSIRVSEGVKDTALRVYRDKFLRAVMPTSPLKAIRYVNKGCTIGIGHREEGDLYIRTYLKVTDQNEYLPSSQHRIRIEVNIKESMLEREDNQISNLKKLINNGFKHLQFTRLDDSASKYDKATYTDMIKLFGRETKIVSKTRNKRNLLEFVKPHRDLNDGVKKAVTNLIRNF